MAEDVLRISDGDFVYRISDPKVGSLSGAVLEIGPLGAVIATRQPIDAGGYESVLDVTIELKGHMSRQFFASIAGSETDGTRLTWLNIDPGQQGRLKTLVDAYRARQGQKPAAGGDVAAAHKTRRMIKPSGPTETAAPAKPAGGLVITPFGGEPEPPGPAPASAPTDEQHRTRRVLKPGGNQQPLTLFGADDGAPPAAPAAAPAADPGDDSNAHRVVIEATDRIEAKTERVAASRGSTQADISAAADAGKVVVGQDGRMDIGATLRNKSKTVRASELAARHDKVRVLNFATIRTLITEAVEEAANHLSRALNEADRKRLLEEAEEGFQERMKAFQMEKAGADEKAQKLADQLGMAQKLLEDERRRSISSDQFTVSASGLGELEAGFQKLIDRAMAEGKVDGELEEQLRKLAARVFDEERQRIREKEMQAQNDKIDLLEKKIKRLAGNLEETERQRDEAREIAQALESMGGQGMSLDQIKSKFKIGLNKDDPRREAKLAIMKELLEENRDLRRKLGIALVEVKPEERKPEPPPEPEPVAAEAGDDGSEAGEAAELENPDDQPWTADGDAPAVPEVNPDDLPWESDAPPAAAAETDDGGVKIMRDFKKFEPPPLHRK